MTTSARSPQHDLLPMGLSDREWSQGDSPAKTSATPVLALALPENDPASGLSNIDSLGSYDLTSQSWRTSQHCLIEESSRYAATWPQSGMTRNGRLYPHAPWVRHTCDSACSLWPTPTASMGKRGFGVALSHEARGRYKRSTIQRVRALVTKHGWKIHPHFMEALMGLPLDASAITHSETPSTRTLPNLSAAQS